MLKGREDTGSKLRGEFATAELARTALESRLYKERTGLMGRVYYVVPIKGFPIGHRDWLRFAKWSRYWFMAIHLQKVLSKKDTGFQAMIDDVFWPTMAKKGLYQMSQAKLRVGRRYA